MIILDSTSLALRGFVYTAPRTTNLDYSASWVDITTTTTTPGQSNGALSSTTATDLVAAPAASTQREILHFSICNLDTEPALVTLLYTSSVNIYSGWLQVGECLHYENNNGFYVTSRMGDRYINRVGHNQALQSIVTTDQPPRGAFGICQNFYRNFQDSANLTATRSITSTNTVCTYLGPYVPEREDGLGVSTTPPSMVVRYNVTTAAVTITWAEVAVYAGNPSGGNRTLRLLGYTDVSAVVNSTGLKSTTVNLNVSGSGIHIPPGIGLWAAFGNQASTVMILRGSGTARIQAGHLQSGAFRPSTAGNTVAFTEDTGTSIWCTGVMG